MTNDALLSALSHFKQKSGCILINGHSILDIVANYSTPLYIYDRGVIHWRYNALREKMPKELQIYYAMKANPNVDILRELGQLYDGFDIASAGEMKRAMEAGVAAEKMSFAGPGKTEEELHFAVANGIGTISVENPQEVELLRCIGEKLNAKVNILIRVNPDFELSKSGMKMGGGPKQFGIDSVHVPSLITKINNEDKLKFCGIHIFSGSQNLDADAIVDSFKKIVEYAESLIEELNISIDILNLGGGFGIPYIFKDRDVDLVKIGSAVHSLLLESRNKLPQTRFIIELGRFIIGESGLYVSKVLYKKKSHDETFLILDGGMHHYLAASGNLGQKLVHRPMPITTINRLNNPAEKVNVVGPLCTPLDTFGFNVEIPAANEGDLIGIMNAGAYGYSASPLGFLSHENPPEILI